MAGQVADNTPVADALKRLADDVICDRCGATGRTYGFQTCKARLDERCPGFDRVEVEAGFPHPDSWK